MSDAGYELPDDTQKEVTGCLGCPFFRNRLGVEGSDSCTTEVPARFWAPHRTWGSTEAGAPEDCPLRSRAIRVYLKSYPL